MRGHHGRLRPRELFEAYVARADYQVQLAQNTVDSYAERAEDFADRVGDAYESARDFYEGVTGWIGDAGVAKAAAPGLTAPPRRWRPKRRIGDLGFASSSAQRHFATA